VRHQHTTLHLETACPSLTPSRPDASRARPAGTDHRAEGSYQGW
jgi:hypothetical protein